ncbi:MAG: hypothetical protein ACTHKL_24515, partial [Streptosporangiaceae bacterium]
MNDLEDLVRQELRARVDSAEASQADQPPAVWMGRLNQRIRRARVRRRWRTSALTAVAVAAAIAIPLALLPPQARTMPSAVSPHASLQLSDTAATPKGWVPVAFGAVQISVPADWRVVGSRPCDRTAPGYVVIGAALTSLAARSPGCKHAANVAVIRVLPPGQGRTHRLTGYINGIPLLGVRPVARGYSSYLAPTLHALISVRGPLSNKVLGALTRSPLAVVLSPGPHLAVPHTWHWHSFLGVSFATPGGWALVRDGHWGCPYSMASATVVMIPVANTQRLRCPVMIPDAGLATPRSGVIVGVGQDRRITPAHENCRFVRGLNACYRASPFNGGVLEVQVFLPHRQRATLVQIGLAGSGQVPRTIFES